MAAGAVIRGAAKVAEKIAKNAKKHGKDLKTKKTEGQKRSEKATKGQRTYREGQRKAGAVGGVAGSGGTAALMSNSGEQDYTAANVDLNSGKGLPIADMSQSIDVRGSGSGMRYFQNGKEVRLPKK